MHSFICSFLGNTKTKSQNTCSERGPSITGVRPANNYHWHGDYRNRCTCKRKEPARGSCAGSWEGRELDRRDGGKMVLCLVYSSQWPGKARALDLVYTRRNWGLQRLNALPEVTHLQRGRVTDSPRSVLSVLITRSLKGDWNLGWTHGTGGVRAGMTEEQHLMERGLETGQAGDQKVI